MPLTSALRCGGGLRQCRRRRSEHSLPLPAAACGRSERHDGKEHRRLSRGARGLYGVPVLSMHAPMEIVSKLDTYMTFKGMKVFYEEN